MDWRLRLPGALYRRAVARAGDDATLAAAVRTWLEHYIDPPPTAQQLGGRATAARMTPEQRSERMRELARTRWTDRTR